MCSMGAFDNRKYQAEAKEKWGQTSVYREYAAKTKDYAQGKWNDLADGMDQIMLAFALCMKEGKQPDSAEAQALVKTLQAHITENYYHCTDEILAGLGQMYVCDSRFQNNIDKHGDGTAAFISEAIKVYCEK